VHVAQVGLVWVEDKPVKQHVQLPVVHSMSAQHASNVTLVYSAPVLVLDKLVLGSDTEDNLLQIISSLVVHAHRAS
jgi:hypothetical protein